MFNLNKKGIFEIKKWETNNNKCSNIKKIVNIKKKILI